MLELPKRGMVGRYATVDVQVCSIPLECGVDDMGTQTRPQEKIGVIVCFFLVAAPSC